MSKKLIGLFNIHDYLKGRDYREISKEERLEIAQKIVDIIKQSAEKQRKETEEKV